MKLLMTILRLLNTFTALSRGRYLRTTGRRRWNRIGRRIIR